jgi:cytochrome c oxidase subunit 2
LTKPYSTNAVAIFNLHFYIFSYLIFILFFVIFFLTITIYLFSSKTNRDVKYVIYFKDFIKLEFDKNIILNKTFNSHMELEAVWTIIPGILLICFYYPTLGVMYATEEFLTEGYLIRVVGRQWYWTYEYEIDLSNAYKENSYDSNLIRSLKNYSYQNKKYMNVIFNDLNSPYFLRSLSCDNQLILPVNKNITLLTTSTDVIHSFALPSFALKLDAIPGRINATNFRILAEGEYFGMCSELCGVGHGFMPIHVFAIDYEK